MGQSESARKEENQKVLDSAQDGDLIEFPRSILNSHWAIKTGKDDKVLHLINMQASATIKNPSQFSIGGRKFSKVQLRLHSFWHVVEESTAKIVNKDDALGTPNLRDIQKRIDSLNMGVVVRHNELTSTCENVATWIRHGRFDRSTSTHDMEKLELDSGMVAIVTSKKEAGYAEKN